MKKVFLVFGLFGLSLSNSEAQFVVPAATVNSTNLFTNGRVGIGFASSTTAPTEMLEVAGAIKASTGLKVGTIFSVSAEGYISSSYGSQGGGFSYSISNGTYSASATGVGAFVLGKNVNSYGLFFGDAQNAKNYSIFNTRNYALQFGTNNLERMRISAEGFVGIGTTSPSYNLDVNGTTRVSGNLTLGAGLNMTGKFVIGNPVTNAIYVNDAAVKMSVEGTIVAKRIVCATPAWADFVFDKNYELASLSEVEKYVATNKHLPGIPSADELVKSGIDPAELLKLQMMKIEELTLHLIEQQKQIDKLNSLLCK